MKLNIEKSNQLYPSEHTEVFCDSNTFANSIESTIRSLEAPTTHLVVFFCMTYVKLSQKNKVVLTGEGSDEIFGGYSRYTEIEKILFLKHFLKNYQS